MAALLPGTIPQAHRGIIFVDEINRLADASPEIADVLLDVMGTKPGRIQIEESGLPTVEMPVQVAVWAASNPDEEPGALSQIRKQMSDRFDMAVGMGRPSEVQSVLDILMSRSGQDSLPIGKCIPSMRLNDIVVDDDTRKLLAAIYMDYGLESLRAVEAMETAAKLQALLSGQDRVSANEISSIIPLVLSHRADPATIANILKYLKNLSDLNMLPPRDSLAAADLPTDAMQQSRRANPPCNAKSRVADWWDRVREKFSGKNKESKTAATNKRSSAASSGTKGTGAGGKHIADPTQIDIIAPPNVAAPLSRLSLDEFVNTDEKFRSDR
jgi:magnesium chelatase subunit I